MNRCLALLFVVAAGRSAPEPKAVQLSLRTDEEAQQKPEEDQSLNEAVMHWLARSKWPPAERGPRPPPPDADERGAQALGLQMSITLAGVLLLPVLCFAFFLGLPQLRGHCKALVTAILWQHMHQRALLLHIVRIALPTLFLIALHRAKGALAAGFSLSDVKTVLQMNGKTPEDASEAVLAYCMSLAMVVLALVSMLFFVWHVAEESQSGFRHLLHVSGLSRFAYIRATAGVQGVLQAYLSVAFVLLICGFVLEVRLVQWTSPTLILVSVTLLCLSSVLTGYLLCFLCSSVRFASNMVMLVFVMSVLIIPCTPFFELGKQGWLTLALPVIPAYSAFFELFSGCIKGRCLTLDDVTSELGGLDSRWPSPYTMILGSSASIYEHITPPRAFLSYTCLVLMQLLAGASAVLWLDRRRNPPLHEPGPGDKGFLDVKDLRHSYFWLAAKTLDGVSFTIARGEMLCLLGPNGAGKTTCIRCITGEESPSDGYVGIPKANGGAAIGLCPQETIVSGDLTVLENLLFFAHLRGAVGKAGSDSVAAILRATCLEEKSSSMPDQLSGGMRRRLAVGCAMIATPSVVILDEPTTGLDPVTRRGIWETIIQVKEAGSCCLLTTHMLEEAECLASRIVILRQGKVAAEGSVQQLKNEWGTGYLLSVESEAGKEKEAENFISELLGPDDKVPVQSSRFGQATYRFTQDEEALGHLIISIARGKANRIKHWGISQASLEDAYVRIIQQE